MLTSLLNLMIRVQSGQGGAGGGSGTGSGSGGGTSTNWFPSDFKLQGSAEDAVKNGIQLFFVIVAIAAVFVIIWAGFKYITSAGDTSKAQEAQKQIMYAVIGLVVAIAAYTLTELVWKKFTGQQALPNLPF